MPIHLFLLSVCVSACPFSFIIILIILTRVSAIYSYSIFLLSLMWTKHLCLTWIKNWIELCGCITANVKKSPSPPHPMWITAVKPTKRKMTCHTCNTMPHTPLVPHQVFRAWYVFFCSNPGLSQESPSLPRHTVNIFFLLLSFPFVSMNKSCLSSLRAAQSAPNHPPLCWQKTYSIQTK